MAHALEDAASRLDAGLPLASSGPGEKAVATLRRNLQLQDWEWASATAAEASGTLPHVLRSLSQARRARGELVRAVLGAVAYPALLMVMAGGLIVMLFVLGFALPRGLIYTVATVAVLGSTAAWWISRRLRDPSMAADRWPWLGKFSHALGELPYLTALRCSYGAGVPLREAQRQAATAARVPWVRARLGAVAADLERGEGLATAAARRGAVTEETLQLMRDGEQTGQLEDALLRAEQRRKEEVTRTLTWLARGVGIAAYASAALTVAWIAFSFYANLYASLLRR